MLTQSWPTLFNPIDYNLPGSSAKGIIPARLVAVGSHFLLQGIVHTQDLNSCLLNLLRCWQILYHWDIRETTEVTTNNKETRRTMVVVGSRFNRVRLCVTPGTAARQVPLSVGFSRQEYWHAMPYPPPGDLPDPGMDPESLMPPALAGGFFTTSAIWLQFTSSGSTLNSSYLAISTTSVPSSTKGLNSSESLMRAGINFIQNPVNVDIIISSHESQCS